MARESIEHSLRIRTADGVSLAAIENKVANPKAIAVLAHGITVEKNEGGFYTNLAAHLSTRGISSIRFDFRGHGESGLAPFQMTIAGEILDMSAVVTHANKRHRLPLSIVGTSFGGGIAALFNSMFPGTTRSLVLLCPVLDLRKTFLRPMTPWGKASFGKKRIELALRKGFLSLDGFKLGAPLITELAFYEPAKALMESRTPTLVMHGTKDSMVPYLVAKRVGSTLMKGRWIPVDGADHGFEGKEALVYDEVSKWLLRGLD